MKSGSRVVDEAIANITALYPPLYHMAAEGSWPSIQRHGLLSTSALLDLYEVCGPSELLSKRLTAPPLFGLSTLHTVGPRSAIKYHSVIAALNVHFKTVSR